MKKICLTLLLCSFTSLASAQPEVTVTVTNSPGFAVPSNFTGVSFETYAMLPHHNRVLGYLFYPSNKELVMLFRNSGIRNLRIGGCTVDGLSAAIPSRAAIDSLFGFARIVGVKVIYSLRLLNGNPAADASTAKYIWTYYRKWLDCFSIGNEPNEPPYSAAPVGAIKSYSSYLAYWRTFVTAVTDSVPGARFAGPDAGGWNWVPEFAGDERDSCRVVLITQHEYAGGKPLINHGTKKMPASVAIDNMLSPQWLTGKYSLFYSKTLRYVKKERLQCRMTEADDYLHGVTGASNAFASALWALDYMHWWAERGLAGVNFHNNQWLKTDVVFLDSTGNYSINPKAYAIRAFDIGSRGYVEPVAVSNDGRVNVTAYAVGDDSNLCVTVINKEHGAGARSVSVAVESHGFTTGKAEAMFLTAPGYNAGATDGVKLGGDSMTNHIPWQGKWVPIEKDAGGGYEFNVHSTSAVVLKISTSER